MAHAVTLGRTRSTFVLSGEIDFSNAADVESAIRDVDLSDGGSVTLDLTDLTFIDSTGMRAIMTAAAPGRAVLLVNPSRTIRRILEIMGYCGSPLVTVVDRAA